jgi:hypothetical protein
MMSNPAAQTLAQAEIDKIVPTGELPDFTQQPLLPFTTAIVMEVFRWWIAVPIG